MKKQRWRKTKKVKWWACDGCSKFIKIDTRYEPEKCCDGYLCGCYGMPINPVLCNKCAKQIFGQGG